MKRNVCRSIRFFFFPRVHFSICHQYTLIVNYVKALRFYSFTICLVFSGVAQLSNSAHIAALTIVVLVLRVLALTFCSVYPTCSLFSGVWLACAANAHFGNYTFQTKLLCVFLPRIEQKKTKTKIERRVESNDGMPILALCSYTLHPIHFYGVHHFLVPPLGSSWMSVRGCLWD